MISFFSVFLVEFLLAFQFNVMFSFPLTLSHCHESWVAFRFCPGIFYLGNLQHVEETFTNFWFYLLLHNIPVFLSKARIAQFSDNSTFPSNFPSFFCQSLESQLDSVIFRGFSNISDSVILKPLNEVASSSLHFQHHPTVMLPKPGWGLPWWPKAKLWHKYSVELN